MDITEYGMLRTELMKYSDNKFDAITTDMDYKGSVASVSDLPVSGTLGDVYTVSNTGARYVWDGTQWTQIESVASQLQEIIDAGNTQVGLIEDKGEEVLESIPQDYSELSDLAENVANVTVVASTKTETTNIYPSLTWTDGYMAQDGTITSATSLHYSNKISVREGDVLFFNNPNFSFRFVTCFNGDTAVSAKGAESVNSFTVPSGVNGLIITVYTSYNIDAINLTHSYYVYTNILDDDIAEINATQEAMEEAITIEDYTEEQITNVIPSFTTGGIDKDGTYLDYNTFQYTQKISVLAGDEVTAHKSDGTGNASFRWICAYSGDSIVTSSGADDDRISYTVPEGIDGVVLTVRIANAVDKIVIDRMADLKSAYVKPTPMGYTMKQGSLSDGESLVLPIQNVKINNCYIFNANISTLDKISFSKGDSVMEIDATNIKITNDATSPTIPHGLTIADNISLIIENETSTSVTLIRLSSDGNEFTYSTPVRFLLDSGSPTITSSGSTLTECTFSWVSKNVNAPIWMFGDSYFSWYEQRWTYYLARDGYTKSVMLNGFAGQSSNTAYASLVNLLAITVPKIVVWCLGMNDGDTESAVNTQWKIYYDKLVELQKKYGFELVLYTTPTTPTIQNDFKNAIVRASGFRYIEADKAVRIDGTRNWVSGALDVDDVHPTEIGAKILYYRVIADLPELLSNY